MKILTTILVNILKKLDDLIELYSEWIYVIRTNGKKESNWVINEDVYKGPQYVESKRLFDALERTFQDLENGINNC